MKLAILGGSFKRIHIGHLMLADTVITELGYDMIAVTPAYVSPFKQKQAASFSEWAPADDRIKMIERAVCGNSCLYCEKYEIYRQGISYTIDTIKYLYEKFSAPNEISAESVKGKIGLIIGDDLAQTLPSWKDADKIIQTADIIIGKRLGTVQNISYPFKELKNTVLPISSTEIRNAVRESKSFRYMLPAAVYEYIQMHKLYR